MHAFSRPSQRSRRVLQQLPQKRICRTLYSTAGKRLFCFGSGFTVTALLQTIQKSEPTWEVYTTQRAPPDGQAVKVVPFEDGGVPPQCAQLPEGCSCMIRGRSCIDVCTSVQPQQPVLSGSFHAGICNS